MEKPLAILFDIDGTLITSGGAGATAWRAAFEELHGIPVDIGRYTDTGMTDPEVGRLTFLNMLGRQPGERDLAALLGKREEHLGAPLHPPRVLDVGDTPKDIAASRALGIVSVGVASGHYSADELREAGADHVLGSLREPLPGVAELVR